MRRFNYYRDLLTDYSKPDLISNELAVKLLNDAEAYISLREEAFPQITKNYSLVQIERENKDWWSTHCEAWRQGRGDILAREYTDELVYLCADGPFYGRTAAKHREEHWWAITAQPGVTMSWPIVMFHDEVVYTEWCCIDNEINETIAKGNETILRRGHRGGCYLKSAHLDFSRDVYAPSEFLYWLRREPET
ncbi:hypothetical protein B7486_33130 [cyanobacterium TDX16]|nr:hypothetical protein B7486_33130 [cyanobacterium TDX16]